MVRKPLFYFVASIALAGCAGNATIDKQVAFGALLDLTGPGQTLGLTSRAALEIALDGDALAVEDTGLVPGNALAGLQRLKAKGVRVVFGPQSSSELAACKAYADANDMVLVSMGSTASSLSVANDNVLRFCPPDTREIEAVVAYLQDVGITGIVPVWRDDVGNQGLADQLRSQFTVAGGTVSTGYKYAANTTDFGVAVGAATDQATTLRGTLGDHVAMFFGSFDEGAALAASFPAVDVPGQIAIGGDGMAKASTFLTGPNANAAQQFAAQNDLVAPTFGLDPAQQAIWQPLSVQIKNRSGLDPDAFALAAYDSAVIARQVLAATTGNSTVVRAAIVATADDYVGATGLCRLDANGDRTASSFDFYGLNATPNWVVKASYRNGVIIRP